MDTNTFKKYKCPCCDFYTLNNKANNTFQICPICYWEDDGVQLHNPNYVGGANHISLNQAKKNFASFLTSSLNSYLDDLPDLFSP